MTSPTERSLERLRSHGWTCAIVEKWNAHARCKQDLFGFGDILCIRPGHQPLLVQTTTQSNAAARVAKIISEPRAKTWLLTASDIQVHGWAKRGARGKRKMWTVTERNVTLDDFAPEWEP